MSRDLDRHTPRRRPFEAPLLLIGVRCTVRYLVLPLVLPTMGVAAGAAFGVLVVLDAIAVAAIAATLRHLWWRRHPRRWQYLPVAVAMLLLVGLLLVNDAPVPH